MSQYQRRKTHRKRKNGNIGDNKKQQEKQSYQQHYKDLEMLLVNLVINKAEYAIQSNVAC